MKQKEPTPIFSEIVFGIFRKHAHLLLAWGYERIRERIDTDDEEEITDLLFQSIRSLLRARPEPWCVSYSIHNEMPISGGKRRGRKRREADLVIEYVTAAGRPEYVFEAKPLNYQKTYQRTTHYVGSDGLARFLSGEYCQYTARYPEIAMIGYVLSDDIPHWVERLRRRIQKEKDSLRLQLPQRTEIVIDQFPHEWVSQHNRDNVRLPILIYHILLDCQPPA